MKLNVYVLKINFVVSRMRNGILFHKTEVRYNNVFSLASGNPSLFKERDLVKSSFLPFGFAIADDKDFPIFISAIILAA